MMMEPAVILSICEAESFHLDSGARFQIFNLRRRPCGSLSGTKSTLSHVTRTMWENQRRIHVFLVVADEELSCLATWKEGSSRYLVAMLNHSRVYSDEARYRCVMAEREGIDAVAPEPRQLRQLVDAMAKLDKRPTKAGKVNGLTKCFFGRCYLYQRQRHHGRHNGREDGVVFKMSQSEKASCVGLWSVDEGVKTFTMKKREWRRTRDLYLIGKSKQGETSLQAGFLIGLVRPSAS